MKSKSITLLKAIAQKGQETVPYLNPTAVCPLYVSIYYTWLHNR